MRRPRAGHVPPVCVHELEREAVGEEAADVGVVGRIAGLQRLEPRVQVALVSLRTRNAN